MSRWSSSSTCPRRTPPAKILEAFQSALRGCAGAVVDHIDVLINSSGYCPALTPAAKTSGEDLRAALETNAIASLMVSRAFRPLLLRQSPVSSPPKLILIFSSDGGIAT